MASSIGRVAATAAQQLQRANPLGDRGALVPFGSTQGADGGSFGDTLTNAINQVSMAQERSADLTAAFLRGENVEVHQVMAASEEAGISLELMVEVRNKFAEAYRTLINMQS
jgi:flagellar hook-basal body complex protein FliE